MNIHPECKESFRFLGDRGANLRGVLVSLCLSVLVLVAASGCATSSDDSPSYSNSGAGDTFNVSKLKPTKVDDGIDISNCSVLTGQYDGLAYQIVFKKGAGKIVQQERYVSEIDTNELVLLDGCSFSNSPARFRIVFTTFPDHDPVFKIYRFNAEGHEDPFASLAGPGLLIPGNGCLYASSGHTFHMFNQHLKYRVLDSGIEEIKQPFYAVGLKSVVTEDVSLRLNPNAEEVVCTLKAGTPVEVLYFDEGEYGNDDYLIRTPLGLVGWLRIQLSNPGGTPIKGLYYFGP